MASGGVQKAAKLKVRACRGFSSDLHLRRRSKSTFRSTRPQPFAYFVNWLAATGNARVKVVYICTMYVSEMKSAAQDRNSSDKWLTFWCSEIVESGATAETGRSKTEKCHKNCNTRRHRCVRQDIWYFQSRTLLTLLHWQLLVRPQRASRVVMPSFPRD